MSLRSELKVRTLAALVLIPTVLLLVYLGGIAFTLLIIAAFTLAQWEFLNLYSVNKKLNVFTSIILLASILSLQFKFYPLTITLLLLLFLPIPVWWSRGITIKEFALSTFIYIYLLLGAFSAILIREKLNFNGILFFLGIIWIFDSMAYISGYFFGKHKLAEKVSPKKTVEGYVYGIIFTIPFGILLYFLKIRPTNNLPITVILTIFISILSQIGDLVESAFKREVGVKDSSNLIPGHGGMLDRIDSIIFTAPYFALLTWLLGIWK